MNDTGESNKKIVVNANESTTWGTWFSVWNPRSPKSSEPESTRSQQSYSGSRYRERFEVVQEEQTTETCPSLNSFGVTVEDNVPINDQYVDLDNAYDVSSIKSMEDGDDEKDPTEHPDPPEHHSSLEVDIDRDSSPLIAFDAEQISASPNLEDGDTMDPEQDPVMVSQTATLQTRNEELERERAQLQSETIQLRMQTECLKQSNEHIIEAQHREIESLQSENQDLSSKLHDKDEQLKQVQAELARIQRERDNLQKKLDDILNQRSNSNGDGTASSTATHLANSAVLIENKYLIYGCISCGQHLFDSSAMVQRQIEIDEHSFGLIVDSLFNVGDLTMGPTVCKTFLNGMFKVRELYCDGCLGTFGWKIIESFDEWNCFHQNKYLVGISNIKQISHGT